MLYYTHKITLSILCWTIISLSCSSASGEMIYVSAKRSIMGTGSQLDEKLVSTDGIDSFTDDLLNSGYFRDQSDAIVGSISAAASQTSTLTSNAIKGLGRGSGFGSGPAEGIGRSDMRIEFTTDTEMRFTLAGQLRLAPHGDGVDLKGSSALIRVSSDAGTAMEVLLDQDNLPDSLGTVDFLGANRLTGEFPAGDYVLEAIAQGNGSDGVNLCLDFDFTFTAFEPIAIPEPSGGSMAALGSLAVLCAGFRRSRRRV